jgi:hypothetical protein
MFIFVTRVIITRNLKTMNNDLLLVSNKIKKIHKISSLGISGDFLLRRIMKKQIIIIYINNFTSNGHHLQSDGHFYF